MGNESSRLERYKAIMADYRAGKFGDGHLSLRDILYQSGDPELLASMGPAELRILAETSSGPLRGYFSQLAKL